MPTDQIGPARDGRRNGAAPAVLFVSHTGIWGGGAEVVLGQFIEAARGVGYRVHLASPPGEVVVRLGPFCDAVHKVELTPLRRTKNPMRAAHLAFSWVSGGLVLARIMIRSRPVAVHANSGVAALLACVPAALLGRRLIWHQHDIVPKRLVNHVVLGACGRLAYRVLAISQAVAGSLERLGIEDKRIQVLHNTVRHVFFEALPDRAEGRRQLDVRDGGLLLAMAGRLVPYKGHGVFLDALALLVKGGLDVQAIIAGDKPSMADDDVDPFPDYKVDLEERGKELGLSERVHFLGHVADIRPVLSAADIFVDPAVEEPFGLVVVEAMAAGLPVVASDSGGHLETIEDGKNGLLVATGDAQALADGIRRVITEPGLRDRLTAGARKRAQDEFSEDGLASRLNELYG